jgi:hypothetical protein
MPRQLKPEELRLMHRLAKSGHSNTQIAAQLGCDRHTVARHLGARAASAEKLSPADIETLKGLLASVQLFVCDDCGHPSYLLKSMTTLMCPKCGATWNAQSGKAA